MRKRRQADDTSERGLCSTCSLRETCDRRDVEGGVWHCADYSEDDEGQHRDDDSAADET
jgi:hypothetical protein